MEFAEQLSKLRLEIARFSLEVLVTRTIVWNSYPGSVIHGMLGLVLKRSSCVVDHRDCSVCYLTPDCPYGFIYESPLPPDTTRMRLYPQTPHPIKIAVFPWHRTRVEAGQKIVIQITLFGNATQYVLKTVMAIAEAFSDGVGRINLGHRGIGEVVSVRDDLTGEQLDWSLLRKNYDSFVTKRSLGQIIQGVDIENARIRLDTPLRLVAEGKVSYLPSLRDLVANASRRISNLSYFFAGEEVDGDYSSLLNQAEQLEQQSDLRRWRAERYSSRQQTRIGVDGVVGQIELRHCPADVSAFLGAGQYLGIGKGTTLGLGSYSFEAVT